MVGSGESSGKRYCRQEFAAKRISGEGGRKGKQVWATASSGRQYSLPGNHARARYFRPIFQALFLHPSWQRVPRGSNATLNPWSNASEGAIIARLFIRVSASVSFLPSLAPSFLSFFLPYFPPLAPHVSPGLPSTLIIQSLQLLPSYSVVARVNSPPRSAVHLPCSAPLHSLFVRPPVRPSSIFPMNALSPLSTIIYPAFPVHPISITRGGRRAGGRR